MSRTEWHALSVKDVLSKLDTNKNGLTEKEAKARLERYGRNEITEVYKIRPLRILLDQLRSFFVYLLLFAAIISALLSHWLDFWVIVAVIALNTLLGFVQNYRAEKAIQNLKRVLVPKAKVVRDGVLKEVPAIEIVPGDVVVISEGDRITADARIIEARNLLTNEAILTGESMPVEKSADRLKIDTPLIARSNMIFGGTVAVSGWCLAVITATGMSTELGRIASLVQKIEKAPTPLQKKLNRFAWQLGIIAVMLAVVFGAAGLISGLDTFTVFLTTISLAVAVVPEGLPAVITICLAVAVQRMYRVKSLIRRLSAAETLGRVDVICTDKTGTITTEEMTVSHVYSGRLFKVEEVRRGPGLDMLFKIGCLCNNARIERIDNKTIFVGDPTEKAILRACTEYGFDKQKLTEQNPRIKEFAFTSERKMMSIVRKGPKGSISYVKGAPDVIIQKCSAEYVGGKAIKLDGDRKRDLIEIYNRFAEDGLRVLAFAYKPIKKKRFRQVDAENELIFAGLMGMIDPPRPEVRDAVRACQSAGVDIKMITGDSEATARAVARQIGLKGETISGYELDKMSDEELLILMPKTSIFARTSPQHKLRIVELLKSKGKIVAVTGDGVNDAPALKKADIGVAMGIRGTDVARDVSDIVLMDDNFATIVKAIKEGRRVFDNIKKFTYFLLSSNIAELFLVLFFLIVGSGLGWPTILVLLPIQILWINLVTDGIIATTLSFEHYEPDIMRRGPESGEIFNFRVLALWFVLAIAITAGIMVLFWMLKPTGPKIQTIAFTGLVLFEGFNALNFRSFRQPLYRLRSNLLIYFAVAGIFALQFVIIQSGMLHPIFGTTYLSFEEWIALMTVSATILIGGETYKIAKRI